MGPVILRRPMFDYLQDTVLRMMPIDRYAILLFDTFVACGLNPTFVSSPVSANQKRTPLSVVIVQIAFVNSNLSFPIASLYYTESFSPETVAHLIRGIIDDLLFCDLEVVATVSTAIKEFVEVVAKLCRINKQDVLKSTSLHYKVGTVSNIVHFFDFEWLLAQIRDILTQVDYCYKFNGIEQRCVYKEIEAFLDLMIRERHEYETLQTSSLKATRKLFSEYTLVKMKIFVEKKKLPQLSLATRNFCHIFTNALSRMQEIVNYSSFTEWRRVLSNFVATVNTMFMIREINKRRNLDDLSKQMSFLQLTDSPKPDTIASIAFKTLKEVSKNISIKNAPGGHEVLDEIVKSIEAKSSKLKVEASGKVDVTEVEAKVGKPEKKSRRKRESRNTQQLLLSKDEFGKFTDTAQKAMSRELIADLINEAQEASGNRSLFRHECLSLITQVVGCVFIFIDKMKERNVNNVDCNQLNLNKLRAVVQSIVATNTDENIYYLMNMLQHDSRLTSVVVDVICNGYALPPVYHEPE